MKVKHDLLRELRIASAEPVSGGCIHECYRVSIAGRSRFLKVNDARHADAFAAEAEGLSALRACNLRAPEPLAHGAVGGEAYLLLEYLELKGSGDFAALGRMLAQAHRKPGPRFGWARDNYIGSTPQKNALVRRLGGVLVRAADQAATRPGAQQGLLASRRFFKLAGKPQAPTVAAARRPVERKRGLYCGAGRWCSIRRCTTAIARPTSR